MNNPNTVDYIRGYKVCKKVDLWDGKDYAYMSVIVPPDLHLRKLSDLIHIPREVKGIEYLLSEWVEAPHCDYPLSCFDSKGNAKRFSYTRRFTFCRDFIRIIPCLYIPHPIFMYVYNSPDDWWHTYVSIWGEMPKGTKLASKIMLLGEEVPF